MRCEKVRSPLLFAKQFVVRPREKKHFLHTGVANFFTSRGGQKNLHHVGGFVHPGGTNIFTKVGGRHLNLEVEVAIMMLMLMKRWI